MTRYWIAFLLAAMALPARAEWRMDEFLIFAGGGGALTSEERVKTLAQAGFNVLGGGKDRLEWCRRHGVRLMVYDVPPEQVPAVSKHPALWGYHIIDEPLHNLPALRGLHEAYRRADPEHADYSNLISLGGEYLASYMEAIRPRLLSYDYYQYWWGVHGHFTKLEIHRRAAMQAGIPWVLYFEANSSPTEQYFEGTHRYAYRPDNRQRLRQGVFTALAYGLKGVQWWSAEALFRQRGSAELSDCGRDVAAINADLRALGPVLMKLRSANVFHTEPLPRDTRPVPPEHWVQVFNYGYPGLVLGMFQDGEGQDYAMVSNSNWEGRQIVALEILRKYPVEKVERFDRKTLGWVPLKVAPILSEANRGKIAQAYDYYMYSQRTGGDNITYRHINERWMEAGSGKQLVEFELAPGDGELLRITRDLRFETIRQEGKRY